MPSRVTGQPSLKALSVRLDATPAVLDKNVQKGLQKSAPKIMRKVDASIGKRLPHRGGYAETMLRSMRYEARINKKGMTFTAWAVGKVSRRDLPAVNKGQVRHPVFGRRKAEWKVTRIRPGAVSDPLRHEAPRIVAREVQKALDDTADFIEGK